jgi:hypothetical protein
MGIRSLRTASISTGVKRSKVWDQSAAILTSDFESIATTTVGSGGTSTITFSSIPSTYKHLQIRATLFTTAGGVNIQYNGDTGANYTYHQVYGVGSGSVLSNAGTSQTSGYIAYNNAAGGYPTVAIADILDYQNTNKYKTHRSFAGADVNGSGGAVTYFSGLWLNTAAISSINIIGTFAQYSSFALYGIKG